MVAIFPGLGNAIPSGDLTFSIHNSMYAHNFYNSELPDGHEWEIDTYKKWHNVKCIECNIVIRLLNYTDKQKWVVFIGELDGEYDAIYAKDLLIKHNIDCSPVKK